MNGIIGDETGTGLPVAQIDEKELMIEKKMARYSKSSEYKRLKKHFEERIEYYQKFLPGNIAPELVSEEERGKYWAVANIVITELQTVLDSYENAAEIVKEENA